MTIPKQMSTIAVAAAVAAIVSFGAGAAVEASATGTSTTYYACLSSKGALSKVGATSPTCPATSRVMSWNQQGPQGPAGQPNYAYVYNVAPQVVPIEGAVLFDSSGPLAGFAHIAGSGSITVASTGTYLVDFSISADEPNQFSLYDNRGAVAGTTYGSGAGTQQNGGQLVVRLNAGDVLTLVNHTSFSAVTLPPFTGGSQSGVNASMVIEQLG